MVLISADKLENVSVTNSITHNKVLVVTRRVYKEIIEEFLNGRVFNTNPVDQ